ncbi:acyl-CoA--6-aminopenicillanic acid acyltransferase [Ornithinibacillus massiliensis]|uniref:Acyl-CoA--6-aminopenicillanic acid acyltransferase n=1 Tax=Ornithinibacillus massiliensis TaxID=1944633 RepID=A0ABS5M9R9_9BACI|nr:C45 family peptidase [Ornithinibacillus massiliensis]MBS3679062.1 acyl-CoA--6-aminopenicillanic acid acyltransferase [Ornithinibacillus massiliensis]
MRKKLFVHVVELEGTNYEIGRLQAEHIEFGHRFDELQATSSKTDAEEIYTLLKRDFSSFLEELQGLAAGLELDFYTILRMYSGYNLSLPSMGCTAFSQGSYYVRNYDFTPELYDGRLVFHKPEKGYASIGFSQQMVGRLDGMNEHGLVVGLHLVNERHTGIGFIATTIVRLVLEHCKNVIEAADFITKLPHGYCYNYSLTDRSGKNCLIEATPNEQLVQYPSDLMCTNHFNTEQLTGKNRSYIASSVHRQHILQGFKAEPLSPEEAFRRFNNEDSPLFYKDYHHFFGTLHTVVYMPEKLEVIVGIGGNAKPTRFSLAKWLSGRLNVGKTLLGEIDYQQNHTSHD